MFEAYTYFGRVISSHTIGENETHHKALNEARATMLQFERETGQSAWIRYNSK